MVAEKADSEIEMIEKPQIEKNSLEISDDESDTTTQWKLIIVAEVLSALNDVETSAIEVGEWPYMKEIDEQATAQFYGLATSSAKGAHAIFAIVFSIWSYKIGSVRAPLLTSRIIAIIACLIYLSVEYVGDGKRYLMMSVYILLGVSNSACTVLRGYITACSSSKDRPRAFAVMGLSAIVSMSVGPVFQLLFSSITYPGYELVSGIRFHIYSAPVVFAFLLTIVTFMIIAVFLKDVKRETSEQDLTDSKCETQNFSIQSFRSAIKQLRRLKLDWKLIGVCLFVQIAITFSYGVDSISAILFMVQYGWTGAETVQIGSILMVAFGIISCSVLLLYIFAKLGERIPQEKLFLMCTMASGLVCVVTYPYTFSSSPVAEYNASTHSGCNPKEYYWCDTAYAVNPLFSMTISVLITAPTIPMMHTALDTVYSQILGNIDQSIAQGAMTVVLDIASMLSPILNTTIFTMLGVGPLWIITFFVFLAIAFVWAANMKNIKKYL